MPISSTKKTVNSWGDDHPEKLQQSSHNTIGARQQLKGLINPGSLLDQMFAGKSPETPWNKRKSERSVPREERTVFSYHERREDQYVRQETRILIEKLKEQVTLLEKSEKALTSQIAKIKVEQLPQKSGIYYLIFFEWLIGVVKQLRMKVEEGRTWLAAFTSRKKKKIGYWNMYKKHGTTFGLSNERTLSTQTG